jgi:glycosyltransferase involved in cell wall biosynthesis
LTGKPNHFPDTEVQQMQDEITFLGFVRDEDLPALYSAATACFYPSKYEGFGLPPLEAMACGCPVLASNTSSMPEVIGDGGWLLAPEDVDSWAEALHQTISDATAREAMRQRGLAQAAKFSWEKTARETLQVYRELTGKTA